MLRRALRWLVARFGAESADNTDGPRFRPSILDASVRYAHGGSDPEIEREVADIEERGRRLEEQRRRL
jgi:hypothetical protein